MRSRRICRHSQVEPQEDRGTDPAEPPVFGWHDPGRTVVLSLLHRALPIAIYVFSDLEACRNLPASIALAGGFSVVPLSEE
jgi:hypothetical protein